ncbi:MAG: hypothetical protein FWH40_09895, partial [Coriobacteriia bacterium]|nr:hypothetical protein [Coriobacteriia bacterium]
WVTDEDGNPVFVEGGYNPFSIDSKSFLFIYSLSTFSKLLDCTPISFVIAFYIKELQFLNKNLPLLSDIKRDGDILKGDLAEADAAFSMEQMAQVEASLDNLRQAIEDATNLEGARAQADADLALAQMEQTEEALAAAVAYLTTVAEGIRRTIEGSPVMSVAESAASCSKTLFSIAWALGVSPKNVWDLMPFIYSGLPSLAMDPPGNKSAAASPGVISKIVSDSVASNLAGYKAQRRRDFSEDSRHVILDALDWMLIESPLDVTRHPNWPELEQECQRLAPDLLPCFTGLSEAERKFNELVRSSRVDVNRVFDEAQAVDADYAAGIRSDIAEISSYNTDIQELTSSLIQAATSMRRL